ncbi:MAG: hypothetical protein WAO24_06435 [Peptococcia bacterium]
MESDDTNLHGNRVDRSVINISARIADAVEMMQKAKEMTASSTNILITVQKELEELFLSLEK